VQRGLTECGVSECDREPGQRGGPGPLQAVMSWGNVLRVNSSLSHENVITEYKIYFNNP